MTSQLHRQLAPLQPWLMYLLNSKGDGASSIPDKVLGVFLTAAYMVVKGKIFVKAVKLWRDAFYKLLQSTRYGKTPSDDQMKASGGFCPICQDSYQEPTMLHCKHIFCEECVATWFDRDTTCPMCRYVCLCPYISLKLFSSYYCSSFLGPRCLRIQAGEMEQPVNSFNYSKIREIIYP